MPPRGKKGGNVGTQYFNAIKSQKLDTLRWCLRHGGISVSDAMDDEGCTGVQVAARDGLTEALELLLEFVRKAGKQDDLEVADDDGFTPLMRASYNGKLETVYLLVLQGKVSLKDKSEEGKTARDYAAARKHERIVAFLDNPKEPLSEEEEEETEDQVKARVFKASQKLVNAQANKQEEVHKAKVEAAEALQATLAAAPCPVWPEVEAVLKETRRELSLRGVPPLSPTSALDPALWNCVCLQELRIEILGGALRTLPPQLGLLTALTTLILNNNELTALPQQLGVLNKLRNLEAASNKLCELPASLSELTQLQVVDFSGNQLRSLSPLAELHELVSVKVGSNLISELPLAWENLQHMTTLAAPNNTLAVAPVGLGELQMLVSLDLGYNQIQQIPIELGKLNVKKLQSVRLQGNPLVDPRIRRFVEQDDPNLVKDLLNHVRKNGFKGEESGGKKGGGKKGKKGKKAAAAKEEDDDEDKDASIAELLAAMNQGSDDED